jgi:hypothetical protein
LNVPILGGSNPLKDPKEEVLFLAPWRGVNVVMAAYQHESVAQG